MTNKPTFKARSRVGWLDASNLHGFHPTDDELVMGWIEWLSVRRAVILQSPDDTKYQGNLRRLLNADCGRGACTCMEVDKRLGGFYLGVADDDGKGFTYQMPARIETEFLVEPSVFLSWLSAQGLLPSKHVDAWNAAIALPAPAQTVDQRRARYLELFEMEEKNSKRGALTRLATRLGVDRSNLSKEIERAREVRNEQKHSGAWNAQLITNGKKPR